MLFQISLGVIKENPGTVGGSIAVANALSKYVPTSGTGSLHQIPFNADGGGALMMISSQRHQIAEETPLARLEGIEPVPQEFHKRGILLQVMTSGFIMFLGEHLYVTIIWNE